MRTLLIALLVGCVDDVDTDDRHRPADEPDPTPTVASDPTDDLPDDVEDPPQVTYVTPTGTPEPPDAVPLELCINELMPNNVVSVTDDFGGHPDWIELHNPNAWDLPLGGWALTDDPEEPDKHVLSDELVLPAGGFLVLWADGFDEVGPTHLSFSLEAEGETVAVFAPDGSGSVVVYGDTPGDVAIERLDDCCDEPGCFGFVFAGTPGATNVD